MARATDRNGSAPGGVALVLPGGGARGAYEAGALAELLPELAARGERVTIYCGTSVGAINAALLASAAHLPVPMQVAALIDRWEGMTRREVLHPIVGPGSLVAALRLLGEIVGVPGVRAGSVLDARPLRRNLDRWIDWPRLHSNTRRRRGVTMCVVATALGDGLPVAFVMGDAKAAVEQASDGIRYVRTAVTSEHVRASAAIPFLFPAVRVRMPRRSAGWYVDGATRLNTPLKPALDLGADRVIVVGYEPLAQPQPEALPADGPPRGTDILANVIDGLLLDQVNADMHRLAAINTFFTDSYNPSLSRGARAYREARGRHPYRKVAYAVVTPPRRRELGRIAEEVFAARFGGWRGLLHPDELVLGRALGAGGSSRGELLSFLLFDPAYIGALIELGRADARRWLERHPAFWCADSAHDFDIDPSRAALTQEAVSLQEWRELVRRR